MTSTLRDVTPPPKPTGGAFGQQAVFISRLNKGFTDIFRYEPLRVCGRRGGERPDSDRRGCQRRQYQHLEPAHRLPPVHLSLRMRLRGRKDAEPARLFLATISRAYARKRGESVEWS